MRKIDKKTAYSLGVFLAEYLISNRIPSLSCYPSTRKIIQVTWGEAQKTKALSEAWFSKLQSEQKRLTKGLKGAELYRKEEEAKKNCKDEWNEDMKYRYMLKEKYLPHTLKCFIPYVDFSDEETNKIIKKGLADILWDWDFCEYSIKNEDIIFENENDKYGDEDQYEMNLAYITLKLDLNPPSSYTGEDWIEIKTPQKEL